MEQIERAAVDPLEFGHARVGGDDGADAVVLACRVEELETRRAGAHREDPDLGRALGDDPAGVAVHNSRNTGVWG